MRDRPKWCGWRVVMDKLSIVRGEQIPRWYGVAWREFDRDCVVVMPIPLNVLVGWARRFWHWLRWGFVRESVLDEVMASAFQLGRLKATKVDKAISDAAHDAGFQAGLTQGRTEGLTKAADFVEELVEKHTSNGGGT